MNNLIASALVAILLLTSPALAHASLKSSVPAADASVTSPEALDLSFSEVLNLAFSGVRLIGPDGSVIETGKPVAIGDGTQMSVLIPALLTPGNYIVEWNVLSTDGHKLDGSFRFTVTQ